ncbi:MAG: hypothetical protein WAJ91_06850, partial [Rhodoplanes sp.]
LCLLDRPLSPDDDGGDWPILRGGTESGAADFAWIQAHSRPQHDGSVELRANGSLEGEFAYDNGDEATLKARPW